MTPRTFDNASRSFVNGRPWRCAIAPARIHVSRDDDHRVYRVRRADEPNDDVVLPADIAAYPRYADARDAERPQ